MIQAPVSPPVERCAARAARMAPVAASSCGSSLLVSCSSVPIPNQNLSGGTTEQKGPKWGAADGLPSNGGAEALFSHQVDLCANVSTQGWRVFHVIQARIPQFLLLQRTAVPTASPSPQRVPDRPHPQQGWDPWPGAAVEQGGEMRGRSELPLPKQDPANLKVVLLSKEKGPTCLEAVGG